jgi:hypothetical protein
MKRLEFDKLARIALATSKGACWLKSGYLYGQRKEERIALAVPDLETDAIQVTKALVGMSGKNVSGSGSTIYVDDAVLTMKTGDFTPAAIPAPLSIPTVLDAGELRKALKLATVKKEDGPLCVAVIAEGVLLSADGHRMTRTALESTGPTVRIIPTAALIGLLGVHKGAVEIWEHDGAAILRCGDHWLWQQLPDSAWPLAGAAGIGKDIAYQPPVILDTAELKQAVTIAMVIAREAAGIVRLVPAGPTLWVAAKSYEGNVMGRLSCGRAGNRPTAPTAINGKFLLDALKAAGPTVSLTWAVGDCPIKIGDDKIIMSMHVS